MARKRTFVEWMILIISICVIGGVLLSVVGKFLGFGPGVAYSEGTRSGVVYKFSKKGFVYHTWEGELSLGLNERDESGAIIPAIFQFSCSNEEIAKQVIAAEKSGKRVTLHYKEYFFRGYSYGETNYDIIKVEMSEEKANLPTGRDKAEDKPLNLPFQIPLWTAGFFLLHFG